MTQIFRRRVKLQGQPDPQDAEPDDAATIGDLLSNTAMPEPDDDGKIYGRSRQGGDPAGDWEEVIEEPPDDGKLYLRARQSGDPAGTWEELVGGAVGAADQVVMGTGNTLTVSNAVGGYPIGSTISTTDSVWDFIKKLLNPRTPPVYVQPTLGLTGSNPSPGGVEIGTNIGPTLTPNFQPGDSGGITAYRLSRNATNILTGAAAAPHADLPAFQLTANVSYQAQADYAAGSPKPDSEGVLDPPGSGIAVGTVNSNTVTYQAQRRAFFGNLMVNAAPTTEAQIRALANNPLNARTMSVDVNGSHGVCFAYPQEWGTATTIMSSTLGNVTSGFTPTTVSVAGANNYSPIAYLVYANPSAGMASTSNIYTLTV